MPDTPVPDHYICECGYMACAPICTKCGLPTNQIDPPLRPAPTPTPDDSTCPRCEGSGKYQRLPGSPVTDCAVCNGAGKIGPDGAPTPDAAALTAEPLLPWLEKWQEHLDEYFFQLSHMGDCQQFAQAVHSRLPEIIATLRSQAAEIERLQAESDPAVCRLQFPDGSVPGNAREAAEGWKRHYDRLRAELAATTESLMRIGTEAEVRWQNLYAAQGRELAACRAALEPFADYAKSADETTYSGRAGRLTDRDEIVGRYDSETGNDIVAPRLGDCRIARAALASAPPPEATT